MNTNAPLNHKKDTLLYELSDYGILQATGKDTVTFFQGQLTNDVTLINSTQAQLTANCSPKGRMLASMRMFQQADAYYLLLPKALIAARLKKLSMYIMHADVHLKDVSDEFILFGLTGTKLDTLSSETLPDKAYDVLTQDNLSIICIEQGRYLYFSNHIERMKTLWETLQPQAQVVDNQAWRLSEIRAGVPTILPQTEEAFVPQMANLGLLGGISFTKGCYTGQEIVARMHYLGKLKKRMYHASIRASEPPQPGDKLYRSDAEQSVGEIVDIQSTGADQYELLAVLQIAHIEKTLHWQSTQGPELALLTLPYAFE